MAMQLVSQHIESLDSQYEGPAQSATFNFSTGPDQFGFLNDWLANAYINDCKNAVKTESPIDDILRVEVYRDTAPTWQTDYELKITATDRTGNVLPWLAIIAFVAIALIVVYFVIKPTLKAVQDLIYGPGGSGGNGSNLVSMAPWIVAAIIAVVVVPPLLSQKR